MLRLMSQLHNQFLYRIESNYIKLHIYLILVHFLYNVNVLPVYRWVKNFCHISFGEMIKWEMVLFCSVGILLHEYLLYHQVIQYFKWIKGFRYHFVFMLKALNLASFLLCFSLVEWCPQLLLYLASAMSRATLTLLFSPEMHMIIS